MRNLEEFSYILFRQDRHVEKHYERPFDELHGFSLMQSQETYELWSSLQPQKTCRHNQILLFDDYQEQQDEFMSLDSTI